MHPKNSQTGPSTSQTFANRYWRRKPTSQAGAQSAGTRSAPATACRDEPQTDPLGFLARGGRHSVRFTDELMSASMIWATAPTRSVKGRPSHLRARSPMMFG